MLTIDFYDNEIETEKIIFVVISAFYKEQLVLVKHKERTTWEIPGGHRENNESAFKAAKRELYEETGALDFNLERVCGYSVTRNVDRSFGILYRAYIDELGEIPESEIGEVGFFDRLPENLTYPQIQPILLKKVLEKNPAKGI